MYWSVPVYQQGTYQCSEAKGQGIVEEEEGGRRKKRRRWRKRKAEKKVVEDKEEEKGCSKGDRGNSITRRGLTNNGRAS